MWRWIGVAWSRAPRQKQPPSGLVGVGISASASANDCPLYTVIPAKAGIHARNGSALVRPMDSRLCGNDVDWGVEAIPTLVSPSGGPTAPAGGGQFRHASRQRCASRRAPRLEKSASRRPGVRLRLEALGSTEERPPRLPGQPAPRWGAVALRPEARTTRPSSIAYCPLASPTLRARRRPVNCHVTSGGKKLRYVARAWLRLVATEAPRSTNWLAMNLPLYSPMAPGGGA